MESLYEGTAWSLLELLQDGSKKIIAAKSIKGVTLVTKMALREGFIMKLHKQLVLFSY
jgi:hypothetical protein